MSGRGESAMQGAPEDFPAELGGWRLVELLGRGGMGEVWRGERDGVAGVRRRAAIKRILPSLRSDNLLRERFLSEARTSSRLEHPNIVQVLDLGDRPEPFLVFEYIEGVTAGDILREISVSRHPMPPVAAAYIAAEVATGLDYAHRKRDDEGRPLEIVHRDVSPHNVLISLEGAVKVTDFGVARARDNSVRTAAGMSVGKLVYMAPEQAAGQTVDARADVFSLGVSLWEMLTCKPLLPRNDPAGALQALQRCDFSTPSQMAPHLPQGLDAVVMAALAREPSQRYASAGAFAQALRGVVHTLAPGFGGADLVRSLAPLMPGVRFRASVPPPAMPAGVSAGYPALRNASGVVAGFSPQAAAAPGGAPGYAAPGSVPRPNSAVVSQQGAGAEKTSGGNPVLPAYGPPASAMVSRGGFGNSPTAYEAGLRTKGSSRVGLVIALMVVPALVIGGLIAAYFVRAAGDAPDARPNVTAAGTARTPSVMPGVPPVPSIPSVPLIPSMAPMPMVPPVPTVPAVPTVPIIPSGLEPSAMPAVSAAPTASADPSATSLPAVPSAPVPSADPTATAPSAADAPAPSASATAADGNTRHHGHHGSSPVGLIGGNSLTGSQALTQMIRTLRSDVQSCVRAVDGSNVRVEVVVVYDPVNNVWNHFEVKSDQLDIDMDQVRCVRTAVGPAQVPGTEPARARVVFSF